jgi:hypothetical protein
MREICDFLGEMFYPQILMHGEIETHSANKQNSLLKRDLHFIHSHTQQLMNNFGYGCDNLQLSWQEKFLYGLVLPINLATLLAGTLGAELGQREIIQTELSL